MTPIEPTTLHEGGRLVNFGKDQDYQPLPASVDAAGLVMTEWALTDDERDALLVGGHVRIWLHTFNRPLQPLRVEVAPPECCGFEES